MKLYQLTISQAHSLLKKKEISSEELVKSVWERIDEVEPKISAFNSFQKEETLKNALKMDLKMREGKFNSPLAGIPIAIKDNICTEGFRTTCSSRMLENFVSPYDATVIKKLKEADSILIGKTNMDEFAMGSSTENSAFKKSRNPWDIERIPGGSSGGSAAAVSADECMGALGSDTGGSIRQPAACCGVVGFKPTYGRVSRFGLVAFASSLDQIGPITKDVTDAAIMLNAISGHDPSDSTSSTRTSEDYTKALRPEVRGIKIGIPKEYLIPGIDTEIEKSVMAAVKIWEKCGAEVSEISLPHTAYAVATYYILATAEASSNLERYDGVKYGYRSSGVKLLNDMYEKSRAEGFGPEVKRRIMLGTYALSSGYYDAYYKKAQQVRTLFIRDFTNAFKKVDVIVTPTTPTPAFKIGEKVQDPLQMYLSDIFTISANLAGIPAVSLPGGFSSQGMPIGIQVMGRYFEESILLNMAYAFEQASGIHNPKPNL
ncbi:MAG: Asp-tRNA(Asn)/Glu-tRNA(Gln) amidotransferase subunit GatA [Nitrospirae bacterium]|nr:Asp-tRNA(Asn)/Glu-tRNA(Gln) amidotransferase subunit GatA [Nitrospirota bacterium]MBI3594752.1 Asp-tRNA(Asn)/Glu-tRNA(Gln) amidotransferase subunit GatA [Nitrospirota bacterium]